MNAVLGRRLGRAARVRDFIRAHRTDGAGEGTAVARLEELLQRAEALAAQQRAGVVATRSATMQRRELRHALQTKLLKYLAAVGAVAAKGNTELAPQFRLPPSGASHQVFLTAARGMLEKASAQKELLVSRGMSGTLVDDLATALAQFEKTLEATRAGRRDHVGASADLQDRKSTRLNSSHGYISYAVFCLKKKKQSTQKQTIPVCLPSFYSLVTD